MINKKGLLVLRDVVFMMLMVSAIFVFAGLFVSEMAINYDNTNMTNEWAVTGTNTIAGDMLNNTHSKMEVEGDSLETGILDLIWGFLDSMGGIIAMVLTAPNTIGSLVAGTLEDVMGTDNQIITWIGRLITGLLWAIIIFTIYSSFLKGGKL